MKSVTGPDDYASMKEVIRRRYTRLLKESQPLPDLILVDGGKGQLSAALSVIEDELGMNVPVAGMAKNDKHIRPNSLWETRLPSYRSSGTALHFIFCSVSRTKSTALLLHFTGRQEEKQMFSSHWMTFRCR